MALAAVQDRTPIHSTAGGIIPRGGVHNTRHWRLYSTGHRYTAQRGNHTTRRCTQYTARAAVQDRTPIHSTAGGIIPRGGVHNTRHWRLYSTGHRYTAQRGNHTTRRCTQYTARAAVQDRTPIHSTAGGTIPHGGVHNTRHWRLYRTGHRYIAQRGGGDHTTRRCTQYTALAAVQYRTPIHSTAGGII